MDDRLQELARTIIDGLNLEDMQPADIDPAAPLFGSGLGLDSIDALELAVVIDRTYGVRIEDNDQGRAAFASLQALADYLQQKQAPVR